MIDDKMVKESFALGNPIGIASIIRIGSWAARVLKSVGAVAWLKTKTNETENKLDDLAVETIAFIIEKLAVL